MDVITTQAGPVHVGLPETEPEPVRGCDACGALHRERGVARRDGNLSGVTDCNIAMRSHHQAAER
ncbi:hypothetical protein [Streptomyces sp. NBC_00078]|uniref:hypothetical protein n=1 Tax=unclassified Streptomyces TaxID=2593676 RepID=UPI00225858D4|nr:hypothetical protein [Streptomyces sp. NBC_00078]MCX5418154.1 hypothetical protein [Streptomyces sp. NBC_00078]